MKDIINKDSFTEFSIKGNLCIASWSPTEIAEGVVTCTREGVMLNKSMTLEQIVATLVRVRYSAEDEIALLNKAIAEESNAEYNEYNEWKDKCKMCAMQYLGIEVDLLDKAKADKIKQLTAYDKSSAVNEFTLFGHPTWLELRKREDMRQSLVSLKAKGFEEFTYWLDTTPITLPIAQFEAILDTVEVYAIQCFNVTASHKAAILALETIEEVEAYDFTTGYPEKVSI